MTEKEARSWKESDCVGKSLDNFSRGKWKKGQFIYRSRRSSSSVFDRDLFAHLYCGTRKINDIHQDSKYGLCVIEEDHHQAAQGTCMPRETATSMDIVEDFPPPPPEMLADEVPYADEEEGEQFEFDDSGDEFPEADRSPHAPPAPDYGGKAQINGVAPHPQQEGPDPRPSNTEPTAAAADTDTVAAEPPVPVAMATTDTVISAPEAPVANATTETTAPVAAAEGDKTSSVPADADSDLPPPPPPEDSTPVGTDSVNTNKEVSSDDPPLAVPRTTSQKKVNPYSVIEITPLQLQQLEQQHGPVPTSSSPGERVGGEGEREGKGQDVPPASPLLVPSGYSVPVPCGYATPSGVPLITPAYTTPVIIRHFSVEEDDTVVGTGNISVDIEEYPAIREEDALSKWVSDPANTAWMENPDEVIYDDVPRENSDSTTEPDEMIYDDVEFGEEGCGSSLDNGWSSSEFESYDEQSDGEGRGENGLPDAFMRGKPPQRKTHMQKLVKAARDGTKDGLEKTKAAVRRGRSYIKTHCHERKSTCFEDEESELFIEVECFNMEPVLSPVPEGLSQQQVVRRCILGSILESEKNYLDALKRILEQYEKPLLEIEPRLLSDRKLKVTFYRIREILQCHALFQIALACRVAEWDSLEMIGDVFVASFSKSMVLDAYCEYVNNFSTAMAVVRKTCASKPSFLDFLKQRQDTSSDRVTLYGLMMKPIQRFPQFILLLQDMLKNTPAGHSDRLPLQMALTELETLAEKLNEKKREADQRCEIRHIAKAMNERYLNKLLSNGSRYLIRSDDIVETVYNDHGEVIKTKERRLFLLNDVLMCATPNVRCSVDGSGSGNAALVQKFLLKWSVPLSFVDVVEFGSSEDMGDNSRFTNQPHSGEKVIINAKPNKLYMGPGQLYQDLQNLIHDLSLVNQISSMIGSLKGNYQNVNPTVAHDWVSGLQRLILKKEEEIRAADRCRIQLQLPGKPDKSGRPTYFSAVFNTFSPAIKQSWISNLQMAKLALEEDNLQGWFFAEDDGNQIKKQKHPLLLRQMPVVMSKLQEFKVECAVHNPEPHINIESTADTPALGHGCVWVASCTNQMGQIAIIAMQNSSPKVTECFNVESRILCMAYVPMGQRTQENREGNPENNHSSAGKTSDAPTVCLGMEEGSIIVYKSSQRSKKVRLQHFFTPDKSTVTSLVHKKQCLYTGLVNGSVTIYSRAQDGSWNPDSPKVLKLGVLPVKAMLAVEEHVWASSGGQVFIISTTTHTVERQLEAHQEEGMVVSHMVVAGVGIWIAFSSGSTLRLFHTETLEDLQDINIATPVHNILAGNQRVSVSSLLVCHGLLLVGTNLGVTVALSVPRLQGIPKVTGRGMVSFHAHHGPVKFLTMAAAVCNRPSGNPGSSLTSQPGDTKDGEKAQASPPPTPGSTPALAPTQGRGVWLGEAGCTSMAIQDSLSSSCGSLALSQGSLEHGPEDGAIYDLVNDPAHHQRGRRVQKVDVSSLLVVSGGLGHHRVNRKTKQSRQEETVSNIMVWQIPLLNV
ncbi:rho guanine nucleotide exchange factor 10-like isoform X2 [Salvelinus fontinalis]|uniref:rho guanine nucleotide exchange factor 10-like isoform X2 n=1 Tax=Salvelinus fontinalis TaxID=8038 RepID=UPI00248594AE|nr:rho guanine nucleotide exchange factor 10-like isoform X2 [Salvelinus fontinalis]